MVLIITACAILAFMARAPAGILRNSWYTLAAMFWELIAAILWLFARDPTDAVPVIIENLFSICNQFYTGPFAFCGYCGMTPSDHHGNCCLEKPAVLARRPRQVKPKGNIPAPPPQRGHPDWRPTPVPPKQGRAVSTSDRDEPMVSWPKYGLTVPLEVWERRTGQNSNESVHASTAKARGLAAMSSQRQAFVPREVQESGSSSEEEEKTWSDTSEAMHH